MIAEYRTGSRLTIGGKSVDVARAEAAFRTAFATRRNKTLFLAAEPAVRYGEVMAIIDAAQRAGVVSIGLVPAAVGGSR